MNPNLQLGRNSYFRFMNFFRKLLFPFSVLYWLITFVRNWFYDNGWWESRKYKTPVICVGNLSVGGTGKSPMIEFLAEALKTSFTLAVLSRGYKRKTSGFLEVKVDHSAADVGDEPLQIKQKFPKVTVAVDANRREGIELLKSEADVILLDDAFQHRKVEPSFSILLTAFDDLYMNDMILPSGNLREPKHGARRADVIVVTKCPDKVSYSKMQEIQFKMKLQTHQKVFFSKIGYDSFIYGKTETLPLDYLKDKPFTLVTGIAKPEPLVEFLKRNNFEFEHEKFADHHNFSSSEVRKLKEKEILITTEKDYVRLQPKLQKFALYYLPIRTVILNDQKDHLLRLVKDSIENFRPGF